VSVETVIDDDIYIFGDNVLISGTVLGDVIAFGGLVSISGNVTGDVMAAAGNVIIDGYVGDDVRVGTGTLTVNGFVGDDMVAGSGNIVVSDDAKIKGDVVFGSGVMDLGGDVTGNVTGRADTVKLSGNIGGNVELDVKYLNVLPGASINGNLTYTAPEEAEIQSGIVGRDITFNERPLREKEERIGASSIIWWFTKYLALLVVGLLVLAVLPNRIPAAARAVPEGSLMNLAAGFLLIVAGLVGSILLFVTVIGIPLGLLLLFMTVGVLYTVRLIFGLWLGGMIFSRLGKESRPWMDMVLGLFLLLIFTSLPWVGFWIYLAVTVITTGALFNEKKRFYKELKEKGML
jgi:cytoskeletal protein CcmA (bactofilin family)